MNTQQSIYPSSLEQLNSADVPLWEQRPLPFRLIKRSLDLLLGVPILIVSLPLQLIIMGLIRLDSPGPVLFWQTRITLNGRRFRFLKFRTMYQDSLTRFPEWYNYDEIAAAAGEIPFKQADDPRVTRVGYWLRRTSLDELPNFWHVVSGEMALVGPRPEIPELLPCYSARQLQMMRVKPGVTGLSQINGRNRLTVAETIELDLYYARHASLRLDFYIFIRSVKAVVAGGSAY